MPISPIPNPHAITPPENIDAFILNNPAPPETPNALRDLIEGRTAPHPIDPAALGPAPAAPAAPRGLALIFSRVRDLLGGTHRDEDHHLGG
jgi:hypothetical protein